MSENYAQTPTQQLIAKLRECETTMTNGPYSESHSGDFGMAVRNELLDGDGLPLAETVRGSMLCIIRTPEDQRNSDAVRQGRLDFEGLATLKNANPTVIAMLERVMELRAELLLDSSISAATTRKLLKFDADLDALAREALKEKADGK